MTDERAQAILEGTMKALDEYTNYDMAAIVQSRIQHLTGDRCHVVEMSNHVWRVVRCDPSNKEVEWA